MPFSFAQDSSPSAVNESLDQYTEIRYICGATFNDRLDGDSASGNFLGRRLISGFFFVGQLFFGPPPNVIEIASSSLLRAGVTDKGAFTCLT